MLSMGVSPVHKIHVANLQYNVEGASSQSRSGSKFFSVVYFNCRSMLPNSVALCSTVNPDIVCVVET